MKEGNILTSFSETTGFLGNHRRGLPESEHTRQRSKQTGKEAASLQEEEH